MTKRKNWYKLVSVLAISILASILLLKSSLFNIEIIKFLAPDFHYNAISMSSIIGGFLFTGISILISTIDKDRIKRLWDNNYLDNLYRAAFVGMVANVISIASAFCLLCLCFEGVIADFIISIEITALIIGIVFFVWSIKHLVFLIAKLKDR